MGTLKPAGKSERKVSIGAGNDYPRANRVQKIFTQTRTPSHLASAPINSELTVDVIKKEWK